MKKIFLIIVIFIILSGGGCTNNSINDDTQFESAKDNFDHLMFSFTEERKNIAIKAFAKVVDEEKLSFLDEDVIYEKTTFSNFPYTANRTISFYIENHDPYEFVFADQLFLYDSLRQEWLPIADSISKNYMEDEKLNNKIISSSDLWEDGNDWKELHKH